MSQVRGGIADRTRLQNLLFEEYQREHAISAARVPENIESVAASLEHEHDAIVDAWLKVIHRNVSEQDIRALIAQISASIHPIANPRYWDGLITIGGNPHMQIKIDLQHPVWRSGTQDDIRERLEDKTPAQVGIEFEPPLPLGQTLDNATINQIFNSVCRVIDPELPIQEVHLRNVPQAGQEVMIDYPGLLRAEPLVASMNRDNLLDHFAGIGLAGARGSGQLTQYVRCYNMRTGNPVAFAGNPIAVTRIVDSLFTELSRPVSQPLAERSVNLQTALSIRQPIERLLRGTADNRELLLALATIQRDPRSVEAVADATEEVDELRKEMAKTQTLLNAAQAVKNLRAAQLPEFSEAALQEAIDVMDTIITNVSGGAAVPTGTNVLVFDGLTGDQIALANRLNIRRGNIVRQLAIVNATTGAITTPDNWPDYQRIIDQAAEVKQRLQENRKRIDAIENALSELGATLEDCEIQRAQLPPAEYPFLNTYLTIMTGPPYRGVRPNIDPSMNFSQGSNEFREALLDANSNNRIALQDVSTYEKKLEELSGKLNDAMSKKPEKTLAGSDACWAVVRQGLADEGRSDRDVERLLQYFRNESQRTPQAVRDIQALARRAFPYDGNEHAHEHWEEGKSHRNVLGMRFDAWRIYRNNLLQALGMPFQGDVPPNPREGRYRLPQLIHVYYGLKHLRNLPHDNPLHLPEDPRIIQLQRDLHEAILDRVQLHFHRAIGSDEEMRQLGIEPMMDIHERLQKAHSYLVSNTEYLDENRETYEKISEDAYRPVKEETERMKRRAERRQRMWAALGSGLGISAGAVGGSIRAIGRFARRNLSPAVIGGVIGTLFTPGFVPGVGTAAGIVVAPAVYNLYKKLTGTETGHGGTGGDHGGGH
jgi:hypothetical protein